MKKAKIKKADWVTDLDLPIYPVSFTIAVAEEAAAAVKAHKRFNNAEESELIGSAFALYKGCEFGVFFSRRWLCHSVIGHELFHVTQRIMHYCSVPLESASSEPYAFLNGWLHHIIYRELRKHGESITSDP